VINRALVVDGKPYPPASAAVLEILPGVAPALQSLRDAGFLNVVVTNQPDVATGLQRLSEVQTMHERLLQDLAIDAIKVCYHVSADKCDCRKPRPGMLIEAAAEHGIDLADSYLVGDRWGDVEAGQAAGCRAQFFIDYGYAEQRPHQPFITAQSLSEVARIILEQSLTNHQS